VKTQTIRLIDVFVLGPLMIASAQQATTLPDWQRSALALTGLATIVYNGINFLRAQR